MDYCQHDLCVMKENTMFKKFRANPGIPLAGCAMQRRTMRELSRLDARMLKDIGLTRADVERGTDFKIHRNW
jgi:hypothetical protein